MNRVIETVTLPEDNLQMLEAETFFKNVLDGVNPGLNADAGEAQFLDDTISDPTTALFAEAEKVHLNKLSPFRLAQPPAVHKIAAPLTKIQEAEYQKEFGAALDRVVQRIAKNLGAKD